MHDPRPFFDPLSSIEVPYDGLAIFEKSSDGRLVYGSFFARTAAYVLDVSISAIGSGIFGLFFLGDFFEPDSVFRWLIPLFVYAAYFVVYQSGDHHATFGMRAFNFVIVTEEGRPVSFLRVVARLVLQHLGVLTLGMGYLMALFHPQRAMVHDLLTHIRIVKGKVQ